MSSQLIHFVTANVELKLGCVGYLATQSQVGF